MYNVELGSTQIWKYLESCCNNLFEICLTCFLKITFHNKYMNWVYGNILGFFVVDVNVYWFMFMFIYFSLMFHFIWLNMMSCENWLFILFWIASFFFFFPFVKCSCDFVECTYFILNLWPCSFNIWKYVDQFRCFCNI
jgi:hypothetical protein